MKKTHNTRSRHKKLFSPDKLRESDMVALHEIEAIADLVYYTRQTIENIQLGIDPRLMVVVGPCSVHNSGEAIAYAKKLGPLAKEVSETMLLVMRVYFDKPRTTIGWKGLIYDPDLDGTNDLAKGMQVVRKLLLDINRLGVPVGSEFVGPMAPTYLADLISWAAIGARTTESQTHREMASGLSMPVGFKNNVSGKLSSAINGMVAAFNSQKFFGIDQDGDTAIVDTDGNGAVHLVLRGGKRPNYDSASVSYAREKLEIAGLSGQVMVDCSHDNSGFKFNAQTDVWEDVIDQRLKGNTGIIGLMLESNLNEGQQKNTGDIKILKPGISITDGCIGWETTNRIILEAHEKLKSHIRQFTPKKAIAI